MSVTPISTKAAPRGDDRAIDGWVVRLAVDELRPGTRFYFDEEFGGEGDVVTVESQATLFGTIEVWTEERDLPLEFQHGQWVTLASEEA